MGGSNQRPARREWPAGALAGVAAATLVCIGAGLLWAASLTDQLALRSETAQLERGLALYRERMQRTLATDIGWDEVLELADADAAADHAGTSVLSTWLHDALGVDYVAVFDGDDQVRYLGSRGERLDPATMPEIAADVAGGVAAVREAERAILRGAAPALAQRAVQFRVSGNGEGWFVAAAGGPLHARAAAGAAPVLVALKRIDQRVVDEVAGELLLERPHLEPGRGDGETHASVTITDDAGRHVARIGWDQARPGNALLTRAAPFVLGGALALLALGVLAATRFRDAHLRLADSEERAVQQAALLERMSAMGQIGAWEIDPNRGTLRYSRQSYEMAELEPDSPITPASSAALYRGDSFQRVDAALRLAVREGTPFDMVVEMRSAKGNHRTARIQGVPEMVGGRCRRISGTLQDITAQVAREQALARQAEQLERMSRIARIGAWDYDVPNGRLMLTGESYRIYGLDPGEPVQFDAILAMYAEPDRRSIRRAMQRALSEGESWELECNALSRDGRSIWVRGLGEVERRDGRIVRLFGTLQDSTRERLAANELAATLSALQARNDELHQFTRAASHDLQEPVRKVQALGSLLLERHGAAADTRSRDTIERMRGAAARMGQLVDDLLAYSRITPGLERLQPVALSRVVADVVDDLGALIDRTEGRVDVGPLPDVVADPTQIRQLMQNLVGNALKYRHPSRAPRVVVEGEVVPGSIGPAQLVRVTVRDNGIGFDNQHAEAIFRPFRRLHDRSTYDGSGIGLSLVRRIVDSHQGRVWAEGRPGEGARFVVELPLNPAVTPVHDARPA